MILKSWPFVITIVLAIGLSPDSRAQAIDWGAKSALLNEGMSEQEVMQTIGYRPNKVEQITCGAQTAKPWNCKVYTYGNLDYSLQILFQQSRSDRKWYVNSWFVYP
jgi:hypothetical protein